ncbi:MAG: divergent polysaccharide deacetylase family protein [Alphaproteobacteria bacterium]
MSRSFSPMLLGGAVLVGVLTGSLATYLLQNPEEPPVSEAIGEETAGLASAVSVQTVEPPVKPAVEAPLLEAAPAAPVPEDGLLPAWRRFALSTPVLPGQPMIAVVIDDMGLDRRRSREIVALPAPLTVSYLAYARDLPAQTEAAHAAGHELMLHVPMEPYNPDADPGPDALLKDLGEAELTTRLVKALGRFPGYVGVNNHMGSRFTEDEAGMRVVMSVLRSRGLLFVDSRTSGDSVAYDVAKEYDVPTIPRDVFLDHDPTRDAVLEALAELEDVARRNGYAVAIGHPRDVTIEALREWIPQAKKRGFVFVPVSKAISALVGRG